MLEGVIYGLEIQRGVWVWKIFLDRDGDPGIELWRNSRHAKQWLMVLWAWGKTKIQRTGRLTSDRMMDNFSFITDRMGMDWSKSKGT